MAKKLTKRRRSLLITACAGVAFLLVASIAAVRWRSTSTYRPGEAIEGITSELERSVPADHPKVVFTDVTAQSRIAFRHFNGKRASWIPEDMGSGAAWGDYDNDGWVDLVIANEVGSIDATEAARRDSPARLELYHNNGDGTFTERAVEARVDFRGWGMAVSWADYDNDGALDLYITAYGRNVLYRNNGDGTFSDRTIAAGIGGPTGFWTGAAWGDYDKDGYLDLYVTGYVVFTRANSTKTGVGGTYDLENPASINPLAFRPERNLLFHNNRDGTFTERAEAAGVTNSVGRGLAASWVDLDEDGWLDLYVANDVSQNALYRNRRDGTFEDIGESARVSDYRSSMGIAVGDWNGDGAQDLFLTHWLAQGNALYDNQLNRVTGQKSSGRRAALTFMDESDRYGLGQISLDFVGWAVSFIDYDGDGKLDLFIVNGSTLQKRDDPAKLVPMQSKLFWNRGSEEGFFDVSPVSGPYFQKEYIGRGAAFADYDNDGDVDVFVVNHSDRGLLLRNDGGNHNRWLQVELRGTKSNRQAIGAKVRIVAGDERQVRQVGSQSPYLSQNSLVESFGLGEKSIVDTIEVLWPSGIRDIRTNVGPNQRLRLVEGEAMTASQADASANQPKRTATTLSRDGVQRFWNLYRLATNQRVAKQTALAAQTYARALELNPDHEDVLYYSGSMRLELGDFEGAVRSWRHLLEINPSSARTHSQLGLLYQCLDREAPFQLDSAETHFRRAHEINKEENGPLLRLGEVALLRGDRNAARRYFETVRATDAKNASARFYLRYLDRKGGNGAATNADLRKASSPVRSTDAPSVPGEGDTKRGSTPLEARGERCENFHVLSMRSTSADDKTRAGIYLEIDRLLSAARSRRR